MHIKRLGPLLSLSLLLLAIPVHAQTPLSAPVRDTQAIAMIQQSLQAMGGTQSVTTLQDSRATGTVSYLTAGGTVSAPVVIECKGTRMVRWGVQTPNGDRVRILNHGQAVMQLPNGKVRRLSASNTLAERVSHIPVLSLLSEWSNPSVELHYLGPAMVSGHPAVEVSMAYASGSIPAEVERTRKLTQTFFYFDQAAGTLSKMEYQNFAEGDDRFSQKVEVLFSDYKMVTGVAVPFRQDEYDDGRLAFSLVLSSVAFNVGIADSDFDLPSAR